MTPYKHTKTALFAAFCMIPLLFTGCIGDKVMVVRYEVHNRSENTLYLPNTIDASGGQVVIAPKEKKTVHHTTHVCWMGDCRAHIKTEMLLDTLKVYQDSMQVQTVGYNRDHWKLRKNRAVLSIE